MADGTQRIFGQRVDAMNIGDHEPVFPDRQRTRTVRYRTEDQLQNLRIKVILQAADLDDNDLPWVRKERVFSWQEKVFGPREFDKYKKLKEGPPPDEARRGSFHLGGKREVSKLDKKYTDAMDHVAQGEIIFSYVDVDPFEDEEEYDDNFNLDGDDGDVEEDEEEIEEEEDEELQEMLRLRAARRKQKGTLKRLRK